MASVTIIHHYEARLLPLDLFRTWGKLFHSVQVDRMRPKHVLSMQVPDSLISVLAPRFGAFAFANVGCLLQTSIAPKHAPV